MYMTYTCIMHIPYTAAPTSEYKKIRSTPRADESVCKASGFVRTNRTPVNIGSNCPGISGTLLDFLPLSRVRRKALLK